MSILVYRLTFWKIDMLPLSSNRTGATLELPVGSGTFSPLQCTLEDLKKQIGTEIHVALNLLEKLSPDTSTPAASKVTNQRYCLHYLIGTMYRDCGDAEKAVHHLYEAKKLSVIVYPTQFGEIDDVKNDITRSLYQLVLDGQLLCPDDIKVTIDFLWRIVNHGTKPDLFKEDFNIIGKVYFRLAKLYEVKGEPFMYMTCCDNAAKNGHAEAAICSVKYPGRKLGLDGKIEFYLLAAKSLHVEGIAALDTIFSKDHSVDTFGYQRELALVFKVNNPEETIRRLKKIADKFPFIDIIKRDLADLAILAIDTKTAVRLNEVELMSFLKAAADLKSPHGKAAFKYAELCMRNERDFRLLLYYFVWMYPEIEASDKPGEINLQLKEDIDKTIGQIMEYFQTALMSGISVGQFKDLFLPTINEKLEDQVDRLLAQSLFFHHLSSQCADNGVVKIKEASSQCRNIAFYAIKEAYLIIENTPTSDSNIETNHRVLCDIYERFSSQRLNDFLDKKPLFTTKLPDGFVDAFKAFIFLVNKGKYSYSKPTALFENILKNLTPALQFELALQVKEEFPEEAVKLLDEAAAAGIPGALKEYLDVCKEPIKDNVREVLLAQAAKLPNADAEEMFRYAEILYQRDLKKPEPFIGKREFDSVKYFEKAAAKGHVMAQFRLLEINASENNDESAKLIVGEAYLKGNFTPRGELSVAIDHKKALKYLGMNYSTVCKRLGVQPKVDQSVIATRPAETSFFGSWFNASKPKKNEQASRFDDNL